jgi:hypothetical protein
MKPHVAAARTWTIQQLRNFEKINQQYMNYAGIKRSWYANVSSIPMKFKPDS